MTFVPTFYPVPNASHTADLYEMSKFVALEATDGLFFPIMLLVFWVIQILGVVTAGKPASRGFLYASFTSVIIGVVLGILALVEQRWIYLGLVMLSLGAFWVVLTLSRN